MNEADALEAAVSAAEAGTDAEIVVVVCPRSDAWNDVALATGGVVAWAGFVAAVALPFDVSPWALVLELPVMASVGAWLGRSNALVGRLPARWRATRVDRAAAAAFSEEAVHATPRRHGVLLFVSHAERSARVLADVGLDAVVPDARWREVAAVAEAHGAVAGIRRLGELLAVAVPAGTGPQHELPDAPRVRP